uniref:ATP-dependent RNA helicase drs1-like isoform X2 n=1 Tax=Erigeron canadensis TaxID=72917 RepID=UPI001CB8E08E|nr:ATP-dependent RNA helicase drs1-like isoform X2 [Erigeron canadensis]
MGKKKNNESKQDDPQPHKEMEGKFLLGKPKFKKLENGRYKCVETGHEVPADGKESYAQTKHCRIGLIDSALARNKPPLNMFNQDPLCRSKLICKLTGDTVNKIEEHIWKHINGKRFLHMLEKQEAEAAKEVSNGMVEGDGEEKPEEAASKSDGDGSKKKKKKDKKNKNKNKKKMEEENDASMIISEVRDPAEKDNDAEEEEFWMPPVGDRWDFDVGKDRWGSDLESDDDLEDDDLVNDDADGANDANEANEADAADEENNETQELSKRTKRMSIEVEPSELASKKKKKKIEST